MNICLALSAVAATTAAGLAATPQPHHVDPTAPRTITVTANQVPPVIRAALLQSTLIELPAQEKVATVFGGDTLSWVIDGGHVASRFLSIKPKLADSSTDVHIISDHGNEYTLQLHEVSADSEARYDSTVMLVPGDQAGKDKLEAMPVFVPAAELDRAKQESAEAKASEAAMKKADEVKAEQYRSQYPGTLHFDYRWDESKGKTLGLDQIWRDDKFTYVKGQFQETPALYEIKEGKPSLINFDFASGLYTVPKQLDRGYLVIGKQRVDFSRKGQ